MLALVQDKLCELPPILATYDALTFAAWRPLWEEHPRAWSSLVNLALKRHVVSGSGEQATSDPYVVQVPWACQECGQCFESKMAMIAHGHRLHNWQSWTGQWVVGSICPICDMQFWSSWRLRRHLERGSWRCAMSLQLWGDKPAEDELAAARQLEAADRREFKRQGRSMDAAALPAMALREALRATA